MRWILDLLYTIYFVSVVATTKALEKSFWAVIIPLHIIGYPLMAIIDVSYFVLHARARALGGVSLKKLFRELIGKWEYYGLNYLLFLFFAYYTVSLLVLLVGYYGNVAPLVYYVYPILMLYLLPFLLVVYIFPSMSYKAAHNASNLTRGEKIRVILLMGLPICLAQATYNTCLQYLLTLYPNSVLLGVFYDRFRALLIAILAAYYFDWMAFKLSREKPELAVSY